MASRWALKWLGLFYGTVCVSECVNLLRCLHGGREKFEDSGGKYKGCDVTKMSNSFYGWLGFLTFTYRLIVS